MVRPLVLLPDGTSHAITYAEPFQEYWWAFWLASALYLPVIVGLRYYMSARKPYSLKGPLFAWNAALAGLSMVMLYRMWAYVVNLWSMYGFHDSLCLNRHYGLHEGTSWAFAMMGYSKVAELVDTVFLVLRRKPVMLLHWYHHLTVLLYVWYSQVAAQTNAHIVFTVMNCFVHSLMYSYYAAAAIGIFFPFPQLLTVLQILQMVVGTYTVYASGACPEHSGLWWAGIIMYLSYFALFTKFFYEKYSKKPDARFTLRQTPSH